MFLLSTLKQMQHLIVPVLPLEPFRMSVTAAFVYVTPSSPSHKRRYGLSALVWPRDLYWANVLGYDPLGRDGDDLNRELLNIATRAAIEHLLSCVRLFSSRWLHTWFSRLLFDP